MKKEIDLKWNGKMSFTSVLGDHKITVDAAPEFGGENTGPGPKTLIMVSLAGCTGMDIVSLLEKMRVDFKTFNIKVEAELSDEHPKKYNELKVIYELSGNNIEFDKVEKAVKLSEEKYCGVWATLKPGVKISYEIRIN
jgi:putative redox protein